MSAPGRGERADPHRESASALFSEAEKIMAEWEARHDVAAAGRRPTAFSVGQYLSRTRCMDACSAPEHGHAEHAAPRPPRRAAPPDPKPHVSDLLAWIVAPTPARRDERGS